MSRNFLPDTDWLENTLTLAVRYGWNIGVFRRGQNFYEEPITEGSKREYVWTSDGELEARFLYKGRTLCVCGKSIHVPREACGDCVPDSRGFRALLNHQPKPFESARVRRSYGFGTIAEFNFHRHAA